MTVLLSLEPPVRCDTKYSTAVFFGICYCFCLTQRHTDTITTDAVDMCSRHNAFSRNQNMAIILILASLLEFLYIVT